MSERLTKECLHDKYNEWCIDEEDKTLCKTNDINGENYFVGKAIEKLSEFEGFMEEYGFDNIGELKKLIDEDTERMRSVLDHEKEFKAIKSHWEKLKEFIRQEIIEDKKLIAMYEGHYYDDGDRYLEAHEGILDKMQELEKESKDEV